MGGDIDDVTFEHGGAQFRIPPECRWQNEKQLKILKARHVQRRCTALTELTVERLAMASIRKEISLGNSAGHVWDAMRDFQAVHKRVAPGFLLDNRPEDGARVLTFGSGAVFRELLVSCDDQQRRLVYAIAEKPFTTYSAAVQIFDEGDGGSRLAWTIDFLPNELSEKIASQMDAALRVMKPTLEQAQSRSPGDLP